MRTPALVILTCLLASAASPGAAEEWEFSDVSRITFDGTSGDVVIKAAEGGTGWVELESDVSPRGAFEPSVVKEDSRLRIHERWRGGSSRGRVTWTIYLPGEDPDLLVRIETASGDFEAYQVGARFDVRTASGDVKMSNVTLADRSDLSTASGDCRIESMTVGDGARISTASGDVVMFDVTVEDGSEISTASGNVECTECRGTLNLSAASGDVIVKDSDIQGVSELSSASGDVRLHLAKLPDQDLFASSASGQVLLDVEDFGNDYRLVLIKREDRGRIVCPFDFTSESTFRDHHYYEEKIVESGSGGPEIALKTASGRVIVEN